MADPTKYERDYSFTDYQASNPSAPLPGLQVDNELEGVETSLGEAIDAIKDVRRSDGALKNGIVTVDSLDATVAAGVGAGALASAEAAAASADAASDSAVAAAASASAAGISETAASGYASDALTSRNEAETERTQAQSARTGAQTARDFANKWATEAEDVNVDDGVNPVGKSAYHWAQVALDAAAGSIADGSVTTPKLADGVLSADATGRAKMADGFVTSAKIADGTIATGDIADSAITSAKIADGTIATADLADGVVTTAKIADGTIATGDIADGAVTPNKQAGEHFRGRINGLTLSNNSTDATNDIDIAIGSAGSDGTTPVLMTLASALTKRLDAAWAVGTGNGGLDTGSIANTTYHIWLIQRSDTGVVDALFSTSATSPTMPSNYDRKRRIGSIIRVSNTILLFGQEGDYFYFTGGTVAQTLTVTTTASLVALDRAPLGINAVVVGTYYQIHTGGSASIITPPDSADTTPSTTAPFSTAANANEFGLAKVYHRTDTSARLRFRGTASIATAKIMVEGWLDSRGK